MPRDCHGIPPTDIQDWRPGAPRQREAPDRPPCERIDKHEGPPATFSSAAPYEKGRYGIPDYLCRGRRHITAHATQVATSFRIPVRAIPNPDPSGTSSSTSSYSPRASTSSLGSTFARDRRRTNQHGLCACPPSSPFPSRHPQRGRRPDRGLAAPHLSRGVRRGPRGPSEVKVLDLPAYGCARIGG